MYVHRRPIYSKQEDAHRQELKAYIIHNWSHRLEVEHSIRQYWPIRSELVMTDGMVIKDKKNNNFFSIAESDTTAVAQQLHENKKDEVPSEEMGMLGEYKSRY